MQGAKKDEGGFDGDAPTAILIEASSGSVLFEKNADELRAPSSMMKLMTAEVVFNAIKKGNVKLTDEYRISENAWRKGGAPSGGSTMFAAINSKVPVDDLLHGAIIQSGNDACIALAEGMAGNERIFATEFMTKRARELGLTKSTFGNSNGLPDPANKMTVRELAKLARHIIQTYPDIYKLFGEREFTWNKIRQQNRNPLLNSLERRRRAEDRLHQGRRLRHGRLGRAERHAADRRRSTASRIPTIAPRKPRRCWNGDSAISRRGRCSRPTSRSATPRCSAARAARSSSPAREPIKVMVPKNGSEKLIARVVYNGPVRAPVAAGPAGRRGQGLARRQCRDGSAGLCRRGGRRRDRPCAARSTAPANSSSACSAPSAEKL